MITKIKVANGTRIVEHGLTNGRFKKGTRTNALFSEWATDETIYYLERNLGARNPNLRGWVEGFTRNTGMGFALQLYELIYEPIDENNPVFIPD